MPFFFLVVLTRYQGKMTEGTRKYCNEIKKNGCLKCVNVKELDKSAWLKKAKSYTNRVPIRNYFFFR